LPGRLIAVLTEGGGVTLSTQTVNPTNAQTTTSTTFTAISVAGITLPDRAGGLAFVFISITVDNSSDNNQVAVGIHDGSSVAAKCAGSQNTSDAFNISTSLINDLNGDVMTGYWRVEGGTGTLRDSTNTGSVINTLEIS